VTTLECLRCLGPITAGGIARRRNEPHYKVAWDLDGLIRAGHAYEFPRGFYDVTDEGRRAFRWRNSDVELDCERSTGKTDLATQLARLWRSNDKQGRTA
jgi:hypothetical protein